MAKIIKKLPAELFCEVYGEYIPRLCVDIVVIGPSDHVKFQKMTNLTPVFKLFGPQGIVLKKRDEQPRKGQWGLPGGAVFKNERLTDTAKRIAREDLGIRIDVLGFLGQMEFPKEKREIEIKNGIKKDITIDSISAVILARAKSKKLSSANEVNWFKEIPPAKHQIHTPFLTARGLLRTPTSK